MSRYIDADALIDRLDFCVKEGMGSKIAYTFKHIVDEAPSIDIVFCKECRHWHDHIATTWCSRGAELRPQESGWIKRNADDFCSYGERKESE